MANKPLTAEEAEKELAKHSKNIWLRYKGLCALDSAMHQMPPAWRKRWCEPGESGCACDGCANYAGGLHRMGYKKADWEEWLEDNE